MHSPSKPRRDIAIQPAQVPPQTFGMDTPYMATAHEDTLFRDPAHVRYWVSTSGNIIDSPSVPPTQLSQLERPDSRKGSLGILTPGMQGTSAELSNLNCSTDVYTAIVSPEMTSTQVFSPRNPLVSDVGLGYGAVSPAELSYAASIHALTFNDEYSGNGQTVYSPETYHPTLTWSAPMEWPSPSSLSTESSFVNCYATPDALPSCLVDSPPLVSLSEDAISSLSGTEEIFPVLVGSPVQYQASIYPAELVYSNLGPSSNQAIDERPNYDPGATRPLPQHSYPEVLPNVPVWTNYASTGPETYGSRHEMQTVTNANARAHHFYQAGPNPVDNLYHCPISECGHKPDKLKCNYDKHLDSHLKPYRCKYRSCSSIHFSSTACLLRHEREAHGMHGHGNDPFQCHYPGCDRGRGFPRRYNLEDHMRRMHKHEPSTASRRRASVVTDGSRRAPARSARRNTTGTLNDSIRLEMLPESGTTVPQAAGLESRNNRMASNRKRNTKTESRRKSTR